MKLLLDESIPRQLAAHFPEKFEIRTVPQMGWAGKKNGELMSLAARESFVALVTADQGIEYQQNLKSLPLAIVVLTAHRTRVVDLAPLIPRVVELIDEVLEKRVHRIDA